MALCLIALGGNVGDRRETLARAVTALAETAGIAVRDTSTWHETEAVGGPAGQAPYLNGAVLLESSLSPEALHERLMAIEAQLGRRRDIRWGARTVDLDLLLYDDVTIDTSRLTVPHPRMAFRRFVLQPAAEIAGAMSHPRIGWTVGELWDHLCYARNYVAVTGVDPVRVAELAEKLAQVEEGSFITDEREPGRASFDSAGRDFARQIELLTVRRQLLDSQNWSYAPRMAVSNFWIEQELACAWPSQQGRELAEAVRQAGTTVVRPKLLIVLDSIGSLAGGDLPESIGGPDTAVNDIRRARQALLELASRRGVGPLLQLTGNDPVAQFAEAQAAVSAMR